MTYACYCDYDPPEWSSERRIKAARKPHTCNECRIVIQPGQPYASVTGKWDGMVSTFVRCALCDELLDWARISVPCFCWYYGDIHENVKDMVSEVWKDVPGFLFEWGRRVVKIKRARDAYARNLPENRSAALPVRPDAS